MTDKTQDATKFLGGYPAAIRDTALQVRNTILSALPEIQETVDDSARIVGYGLGPGYANLICTIIPSKTGVNLA